MEKPLSPEERLNNELQSQEREIHGHLFQIHQLFIICCDESLPMDQIYEKCKPILKKLSKSNSLTARELEELIQKGNRQKVMDYFEVEKQQLIQSLDDEIKQHRIISKRISDQKRDNQPTDS